MYELDNDNIWKTGCLAGRFIKHTCKIILFHYKCDIVIVPENNVWFLNPPNPCCIFRRKSDYIDFLSNFSHPVSVMVY